MAAHVRAALGAPGRVEGGGFLSPPATPGPEGPSAGQGPGEPICCFRVAPRPRCAAKETADLWGWGIPSCVSGWEKKPTSETGRAKDRCNCEFLKPSGCRAAPKMATSGQRKAAPCKGPMGSPFLLEWAFGTNFLSTLLPHPYHAFLAWSMQTLCPVPWLTPAHGVGLRLPGPGRHRSSLHGSRLDPLQSSPPNHSCCRCPPRCSPPWLAQARPWLFPLFVH